MLQEHHGAGQMAKASIHLMMENQVEKRMEHEMETSILFCSSEVSILLLAVVQAFAFLQSAYSYFASRALCVGINLFGSS